eukprot:4196732-Alexandrium_andersonii.AAC.1
MCIRDRQRPRREGAGALSLPGPGTCRQSGPPPSRRAWPWGRRASRVAPPLLEFVGSKNYGPTSPHG